MNWNREQALIVDSDPATRSAVAAALAAAGYDCHEREDSDAAREFLREMSGGLVVTELDLPGGDGMEIVTAAQRRHPAVGVVVVSGRRDADAAVKALHVGALDYVLKPASAEELERRVSRAGERRRLLLRHEEYQRTLEDRLADQARELQRTQEQVLHTLGEAVAVRHGETHTHTQRVTRLSLQLARSLGLRGSALTGIEWGAALHDVGKIGIPDAILLKPSSLTDAEWALMKQHCEIGHRMLCGFDFLREALAIVLHHHEWYNGRGYPYGLSGDTIPFSARIFAVVDAYDAMTSDRPYSPPRDPDDAKEEIARCAAAQFDPLVVDAFLSLSETNTRSIPACASA
jgi:response regulator RpfG family c-di-GMP phosphodiesterase